MNGIDLCVREIESKKGLGTKVHIGFELARIVSSHF